MSREEMSDFERQWDQKLISATRLIGGETLADRITTVMDPFGYGNRDDNVRTIRQVMEVLESELDEKALHDVITGCSCRYPEAHLTEFKDLFDKTDDLPLVHARLQEWFLKEIREYKNLEDEHIDYIVANRMGMAGVLEGETITAVKIPKDFLRYYQSTDPAEKPYLYCHCPLVREALLERSNPVPVSYCLCGAGFYRALWEYITGSPVRVKIQSSVLNGDDRCTVEISLS